MSIIKSESISKLVTALAIAKAAFNPVLKLNENPGFKRNGKASKYADLATAIEATEAALLANGLVVSQFPVNDGERVGALTLLTHESGEYIGEAFTLPLGQQNAQTGVAAVTYARRTGYLAALGIASEDDDDGQTASGRTPIVDEYTDFRGTEAMPDFQEPRHADPKAPTAPKPEKTVYIPDASPKASIEAPDAAFDPKTAYSEVSAALVTPPAAPEHGDAWEEPEVHRLPTEDEMVAYRKRFVELSNELSAHGKLTASKGLKTNTKLQVFLLSITKTDAAKNITVDGWNDFFKRADAAIANPAIGLTGLTKLVNQANGIESKQ